MAASSQSRRRIRGLLARLVDLVEHAAVVEMLGLGFLPAAEHLVNREQLELRETADAARPEPLPF